MLKPFAVCIAILAPISAIGRLPTDKIESVEINERIITYVIKRLVDIGGVNDGEVDDQIFYFVPPRSIYFIWKNQDIRFRPAPSVPEIPTLIRSYDYKEIPLAAYECDGVICYAIWNEGLVGSYSYTLTLKKSPVKKYEEEFYLPWQLTFGVTSSSLLVEWDVNSSYIEEICIEYKFDVICTSAEIYELLIESLEANTIYTGSIEMRAPMEDLPFLIITHSRDVYHSMDWTCGQGGCYNGGICIPADNSLFRQNDAVFMNYNITCSCNEQRGNNNCTDDGQSEQTLYSSATIISGNGIQMEHAELYAYNSGTPFGCVLPSSLSLASYWCNGLSSCTILFSRMLSYMNGDVGCTNMNYDQYLFSYRLETSAISCTSGAVYFAEHKTCYLHIGGTYPFKDGRNLCFNHGGDIAYNMKDNLLNDFIKSTFYIAEHWWTLGWSYDARPPRQYFLESESAVVDISNGEFNICCDNSCADADVVCALPPVSVEYATNYIQDIAPSCDSLSCKGDCSRCLWMTKSIGRATTFNVEFDIKMCLCCSSDSKSCNEEKVTPTDNAYQIYSEFPEMIMHITYAYFGQDNNLQAGNECRSYSALSFLKLKCDGKPYCIINERDMLSHLSSSCHPMLNAELSLSIAYLSKEEYSSYCSQVSEWEINGIYADFCLYGTDQEISDPFIAKYICNLNGWDLAYFESSSLPWEMLPNDNRAVWAEQYIPTLSEQRFFIYPQNPVIFYRNGTISATGSAGAICFGPLQFTSTTTLQTCTAIQIPGYPSLLLDDYEAGTTLIKPCPEPLTGYVTWTCNILGEWDTKYPDFSKCSHLVDYEEYYIKINDTSISLDATLTELQNSMDSGKMAPGDIPNSLDLLDNAAQRNDYDMRQVDANSTELILLYTNDVIGIVDNTLVQTAIWEGLQGISRIESLNRVQQQTTDVSVNLTMSGLFKNMDISYKEDATYVTIQSHNQLFYKEEANREFCHPDGKLKPTCIILPETIAEFAQDNRQIAVTFVAYSTLHCLFPESIPCRPNLMEDLYTVGVLNTAVIGATVGDSQFITDDSQPVMATFTHIYPGNKYRLKNQQCVWWNIQEWVTTGCILIHSNDIVTICNCTHLTNLAVIMDIGGTLDGREVLTRVTEYITMIGVTLSMICLLLTIVILIKKVELSRRTSIIHINLCLNLLISETILMTGLNTTGNEALCSVIAGLMFYFLLATFSWSAIEAVNIYLLFVKIFPSGRSMLTLYIVSAYSFPAFIVLISAAATKGEGFGTEQYCWLDFNAPLIWAFAGPLLLILLANSFIYGLSIYTLRKHQKATANVLATMMHPEKKMLRAAITLSSVMCITWIFGFMYIIDGTWIMAVIFTLVNSMQGVVLFVVLILFNKDIMAYLKGKLPRKFHRKTKRSYNLPLENGSNEQNNVNGTLKTIFPTYLSSKERPRVPTVNFDTLS